MIHYWVTTHMLLYSTKVLVMEVYSAEQRVSDDGSQSDGSIYTTDWLYRLFGS